MANKLYYRILEIEPGASQEEIKSAWRRKIKEYHPDVNDSEGSVLLTADLNTVAEVLESQQREYDTADSHEDFVEWNPHAKLKADWEEILSRSERSEDRTADDRPGDGFDGRTTADHGQAGKSETDDYSKRDSAEASKKTDDEGINPEYDDPSNYEKPGYPPDWDARRTAVYERDDYTCQNCGTKSGPHADGDGAVLHAHHVVLLGRGGSNKLSNLTTLCESCHDIIHKIAAEFFVQSAETDEPISDARLVIGKQQRDILTDSSGYASAQLSKGTHTVVVRADGYEDTRIKINIQQTPAGERVTKRVSLSPTETATADSSGISRRATVAAAGLGIAGMMFVFGDSPSFTEPTLEEARVEPGESIQETIEQLVDGGSLELAPGTYAQHFQIDKSLSVTAPNGATLDADGSGSPAITLAEADVDITGLTITGHGGGGIHGGGVSADISLSSVTVDGTAAEGVDVAGESVNIADTAVENNEGTGLRIETAADGDVDISEATVRGNEDSGVGAFTEGEGIKVTGGEDITITETDIRESGNENLLIEAGRTEGQSVTIRDVSVFDSRSRSGIKIEGTRGTDGYTLNDVESIGNSNEGVVLGDERSIDTVSMTGVTVEENGGEGVSVHASSEGDVDISETTARGNEDSGVGAFTEGVGIKITGGEDITIAETDISESGNENLLVEAGRAEGQSVTIRDVSVFDSKSRSGINVEGTRGDDVVSISSSSADDNDNHGFDLGGESVTIEETTASGNGDGALNLRDIDREDAEIRDSFQ